MSVGVCTRPTGWTLSLEMRLPPSIFVAQRVRLRPTIQSDCERQMDDERRPAFSAGSSRWSNDSRIDAGVMLVSHSRFSGRREPARVQIMWKISSPSRPASQALTTSEMSSRCSCFFSRWKRSDEPRSSRTRRMRLSREPRKSSGRMGSEARVQPFQSLFSSWGSRSSTRWPTAEVITQRSSSCTSPFLGTLRTLARSLATEGFSAMTRVLPEPGAAGAADFLAGDFLLTRASLPRCQATVTCPARRGRRRARRGGWRWRRRSRPPCWTRGRSCPSACRSRRR